jgi:hypothetical protein
MIIEIKDIPNNQKIEKIDIHIDFQKQTCKIETEPHIESSDSINSSNLENSTEKHGIPDEMLHGEF